MVGVTIDGTAVRVPGHTSILDAARAAGVRIPTLCHLRGVNEIGACRVCSVEVEGVEPLVAACNNEVSDGMVVWTCSPKAHMARRSNVEFLLSQRDSECTSCVRSGTCTLQELANDLGISGLPYERVVAREPWPQDFPLVRDGGKCINCLRCVQVCDKVQDTGIWVLTNRASHTSVGVSGVRPIGQSDCSLCGQCLMSCPTGALRERDDTHRVLEGLAAEGVTAIAQVAPAVRTSWGEGLGLAPEEATTGRLVALLRRLGFDYVFDVDFGADLTVVEEAAELVDRLRHPEHGPLPLLTSCCPGWVRHLKARHPAYVANLATTKSPHQLLGSLVKGRWAAGAGLDPARVRVVSVMPCLAKKAEAALPTQRGAEGLPDVDESLTVRELCRMARACHLDPRTLEESDFDEPWGVASGAGHGYGAAGGVAAAVLRTACFLANGTNPDPDALVLRAHPGGWREGVANLGGVAVHVASASGLARANALLRAMEAGEVRYEVVEVMACPGGCVAGGGQPYGAGGDPGCAAAEARARQLRALDEAAEVRLSHENPAVRLAYDRYLGKPLSEEASGLLHTDHFGWHMPSSPNG